MDDGTEERPPPRRRRAAFVEPGLALEGATIVAIVGPLVLVASGFGAGAVVAVLLACAGVVLWLRSR